MLGFDGQLTNSLRKMDTKRDSLVEGITTIVRGLMTRAVKIWVKINSASRVLAQIVFNLCQAEIDAYCSLFNIVCFTCCAH